MILSLDQIRTASKCYRKYSFEKEYSSPLKINKSVLIAEAVVQRAYLKATRTGYKSDWRRIVGWVDKAVFKDIDVHNTDEFEQGRRTSEGILKWVNRWYENIHLPEQVEGWVQVPIEHHFQHFSLYDIVPIIKINGQTPTISVVTDQIVSGVIPLYNDIKYRGYMSCIGEALESEKVKLEYLMFGPAAGFKTQEIFTDTIGNERAMKMIENIGSMVAYGMDYPSVSEHCKSCNYIRRCRI